MSLIPQSFRFSLFFLLLRTPASHKVGCLVEGEWRRDDRAHGLRRAVWHFFAKILAFCRVYFGLAYVTFVWAFGFCLIWQFLLRFVEVMVWFDDGIHGLSIDELNGDEPSKYVSIIYAYVFTYTCRLQAYEHKGIEQCIRCF